MPVPDDDAALVRQIRAARRALKNVEVTENAMLRFCRDSNCAGHRAGCFDRNS